MTIRTRLTLRFTGLVSAILAVGFASIYGFTSHSMASDFYRRLDRKASTYGEMLIRHRMDAQLLRQLSQLRKDQLPEQKITVYNPRNIPVFTTNEALVLGIPPRELDRVRRQTERDFLWRQYHVAGIRYTTPAGDYVILASARNSYGEEFLRTMLWALVGLFVGIIGIVAFSGWLYSGDALEPMQRIQQQLNHIFPRNRNQRLPVKPENDEISRLSTTLNHLLDRVEESFQLQRMFVANVSHELKNPLTQISSQLEVSLLNRRDPAAYEQTIRSVLEDVRDLSTLVRELLQLSQVNQDRATELMTDQVRIDELAWDVRDEVNAINPRYSVTLSLGNLPDETEQLTVLGNTALLRTALKNLVENACKFSADGKALVSVQFAATAIRLSVQNRGKPIPAQDLPYLFEPFYRGQQTAEVRGSGIGLSLVDRIVRLHQGRLSVESAEGQPTVFTVELFHRASL